MVEQTLTKKLLNTIEETDGICYIANNYDGTTHYVDKLPKK